MRVNHFAFPSKNSMMTDAKKHVEGKANDEGGHDAALASVRDANYDERGGRRTKRRMRKRMGMKRTRRWRTTTKRRRRRRRRRMGKKKRTAMRSMRSVSDYNSKIVLPVLLGAVRYFW